MKKDLLVLFALLLLMSVIVLSPFLGEKSGAAYCDRLMKYIDKLENN